MKTLRLIAAVLIVLIAAAALAAPLIAPFDYDRQFREAPAAPPGGQFLMGTDEVGRDRWSRLLYATRISIVLAPAAALVSILIAIPIAAFAAAGVRPLGQAIEALTTIFLALPWIFVFIILRAELPLDTTPAVSILATFGLMGVAGWPWPARVFTAAFGQIAQSDWLMQARAAGIAPWRTLTVYAWPHVKSIALAQFRVLIPACILSEASLGLLGLGVSDPLPSWGNLLKDLQHPDVVRENPWVLAPLVLLMIAMICLETLAPSRETQQ